MTPHVTYTLDRNFTLPTLISAWSLLTARPRDIGVLFLFTEDPGPAQAAIDRLAAHFPEVDVVVRRADDLIAGFRTRGHVSPAAFARLKLPDILDHPTLYLDGDTLVLRDVGRLFEGMDGAPVSAVRDVGIQKALHLRAGDARGSRKARKHLEYLDKCADLFDGESYFNSGVVLFNIPEILAGNLAGRMQDVAAAVELRESRKLIFNDQTWLNAVFRGQAHFLPPEWNTFWGNKLTAKPPFPPEAREAYRASRENPAIVHFVGKVRPWTAGHPLFYPKRWPWIGRYKRVMAEALAVIGPL